MIRRTSSTCSKTSNLDVQPKALTQDCEGPRSLLQGHAQIHYCVSPRLEHVQVEIIELTAASYLKTVHLSRLGDRL